MKLRHLDLNRVLTGIEAVRQQLQHLSDQASPGLKKFIEEHPMPFATVNRLLHYSEDLAKKAVAIKEAFENLAKIVEDTPPPESQQGVDRRKS